MGMKSNLPAIVTLATETSVSAEYDNHAIARVNDHVVRISRMTQPYHWHSHPNSDETFLAVEGELVIEFENGEIQLAPGQMATVCRGIRHRTRPSGASSVNLIFEAVDAQTEPSPAAVSNRK
jgi:mannose-6-phosphate isomerase-like protein (cupin superfamily)